MTIKEKMAGLSEKECAVEALRQAILSHKCRDCGKCVFGYEGITQLEMILNDITQKKSKPGDVALMEDLVSIMRYQVLCEDGIELAEGVKFALEQYRDDLEEHAAKKACRAGVCKSFMGYYILQNLCTGCGDCMDACDDDAILGKRKYVHVIDQDECIQCGKCMEACEENAIVLAGADKPRCPKKPIPCKR